MLSSLKRFIGLDPVEHSDPITPFNQDPGETVLDEVRMPLEDRMAWRRKMVYAGVKSSMVTLGIIGKWYKFRISQVDERGHVYVIMIDVTKQFAVRPGLKIKGFIGIEQLIIKNIFDHYAIVVKAVYWRTNDQENVFDKMSLGIEEDAFHDTIPGVPKSRHDKIDFQPVSSEEQELFMAAVAMGMKPRTLHVGDKEYYTDIMPLRTEVDFDVSEQSVSPSLQFPTQYGLDDKI
jgi:hypothetical protein